MDFSGIFSRIKQAQYNLTPPSFDPISIQPIDSTLSFIDGGNASLFSSALFDLSFIRIARVIYTKNKLTSIIKDEFFCLAIGEDNQPKDTFQVYLYPSKINTLPQSFFEPLTINTESLTEIPNKIRRYAELSTCTLVDGPVILDGSLDADDQTEQTIINTLSNTVALSKSSDKKQLLTLKQNGTWYAKITHQPIDFYATKLHPNSRHVFRADIKGDPTFLLSALIPNSKDSVFLGYPFGLIQADKFARVSNQDSEYLRTKILSQSGDLAENLTTSSQSAHSILDTISF